MKTEIHKLKFVKLDVHDENTYPPLGKDLLLRDFTGVLYVGHLERDTNKNGATKYFFREISRCPYAAPVAWAELPKFETKLAAIAGHGEKRNCQFCRHFLASEKFKLRAIVAGDCRMVETQGTCNLHGGHVLDASFGCDDWELCDASCASDAGKKKSSCKNHGGA